jgi:hypothetical protein
VLFDDRLFFQIAVGLIPALLFGGLVSGAFRPADRARSFKHRIALLAAATAGVAVVLLAELFAIDLATSPDPPGALKVHLVITAVVGATAFAGYALLKPWIDALAGRHEGTVTRVVQIVGTFFMTLGVFILGDAVVDAQSRLTEQRVTCFQNESDRRVREARIALFGAIDASDARTADLLQFATEEVRLSQAKGLSPSERRRLSASLRRETKYAADRLKRTIEQRSEIATTVLDDLIRKAQETDAFADAESFEQYMRGLGC